MSTLIQKIVSAGVTPDLPFKQQNRIRIFNSASLVVTCICALYTVVSLAKGQHLAAILTGVEMCGTILTIVLMSMKLYRFSFHMTLIMGMIFLAAFCLIFGEVSQTQAYFLFMPMGAVIVFDNFKLIFFYFALSLLLLLGVRYIFNDPDFKPYYPFEPASQVFGYTNLFFTALLIFLVVKMFKNENISFNEKVQTQRLQLEEKNKDITDSIHYARRIQKALMASDQVMQKNLPEYFVLYRPKDIVSGDFYWASSVPASAQAGTGTSEAEGPSKNKFLLCVGDCTGHGVPGAFMSLLGISFLNEITLQRKITSPEKVFNSLREEIIRALNPEGTLEEGKDGMDAVMCSFDFKTLTLEFACSNNPVWIISNKQLKEYKPDKFPIGMHEGEKKDFTLQRVQLSKGDLVYLFTDGYADQFGGDKGKKFKYKKLQELLLANAASSMDEQKKQLDRTIEAWKGNLEQVDDILIVGIRV